MLFGICIKYYRTIMNWYLKFIFGSRNEPNINKKYIFSHSSPDCVEPPDV